MEKLPFEDNQFELVYTRHTLEHLKYYKTALKELKRVSSKRVLVILFHDFVKKDKIRHEKHKNRYLNYYEKGAFKTFLKKLFSGIRMYRTPQTQAWGSNIIVDCLL